jgi:tRNA (cmo5U34)-methyltransferase
MPIEEAFNATIEYYDEWMEKALPNYHDIFGTALALIPFEPQAPMDVLDLGAGTGLFSKHVLARFPRASFVLYDLADKMLGVAKERFRQQAEQFSYSVGDYRQLRTDRTFDLVISSLSIHHLADAEKRALFGDICRLLRPGGVFINVDQIRGETPRLQEVYWNYWLAQVRQAGFAEARIQESVVRRRTYDQDARLADQLQWLNEAGFVNVDCVYKNFFVGVFLAMKCQALGDGQ